VNNLTNQQKGSLMAFIGVMFITPDSLLIRLSNIDTWGMPFLPRSNTICGGFNWSSFIL